MSGNTFGYGIVSGGGGGGLSDIEIGVTPIVGGTTNELLIVGGAGELEQTELKTINGNTIIGSGNIVVTASSTILASQTLLAANWVQGATYYEYTFTNAAILASSFVTFVPQNSSYLEVTLSQMTSYISVSVGSCILYSILPPQNDIIGDIIIQ